MLAVKKDLGGGGTGLGGTSQHCKSPLALMEQV